MGYKLTITFLFNGRMINDLNFLINNFNLWLLPSIILSRPWLLFRNMSLCLRGLMPVVILLLILSPRLRSTGYRISPSAVIFAICLILCSVIINGRWRLVGIVSVAIVRSHIAAFIIALLTAHVLIANIFHNGLLDLNLGR